MAYPVCHLCKRYSWLNITAGQCQCPSLLSTEELCLIKIFSLPITSKQKISLLPTFPSLSCFHSNALAVSISLSVTRTPFLLSFSYSSSRSPHRLSLSMTSTPFCSLSLFYSSSRSTHAHTHA